MRYRIKLPRSKQEIINVVVQGARAQNWAQSRAINGCAYRGEGGLKCHAGHLIADNVFDPAWNDDMGWHGLVMDGLVSASHELLIEALQEAHDQSGSATERERRTRVVVEQFGCTWPEDGAA